MNRLLLLSAAFVLAILPITVVHSQDIPAAPVEAKNPSFNNAAFDLADLDHNGVIDPKEFTSYTVSIKKALQPFLSFDSSDDLANHNGGNRGSPGRVAQRFRGGGVNKFWSGFVSGILTIWATEIGDKTFFIAAILSMKKDRILVFTGAIGALIVMTVLSVVMGVVATKFLPPALTHYVGAILFVFFGTKMLIDARGMSSGVSDELAEVEDELLGKKNESEAVEAEEGRAKNADVEGPESMIQVFTTTFLMTFLAEWGDRSQIATVTLSATKDAFGVTLGAILGHSMCTGLAVIGGKFLATRISERTVTLVGGILFLFFALHSVVVGV